MTSINIRGLSRVRRQKRSVPNKSLVHAAGIAACCLAFLFFLFVLLVQAGEEKDIEIYSGGKKFNSLQEYKQYKVEAHRRKMEEEARRLEEEKKTMAEPASEENQGEPPDKNSEKKKTPKSK